MTELAPRTESAAISRANYWTHPGTSQSQLRDLDPPSVFFAKHVAKTVEQPDTDALRRGRALHALVLEPETFAERFPVFLGERRSNEAKARYAAMEESAKLLDGCLLRDVQGDGGELAEIRAMADAVKAHPRASKLLAAMVPGSAELPLGWEDAMTGVLCKMRLDFAAQVGAQIVTVDLKKTTGGGTRTEKLERTIFDFGLHLQAAHYGIGARANGIDAQEHYLIVVEDVAPFCVRVVRMDPEAVSRGAALRMARLDLLATCRAENRWPGPSDDQVTTVGLPKWA